MTRDRLSSTLIFGISDAPEAIHNTYLQCTCAYSISKCVFLQFIYLKLSSNWLYGPSQITRPIFIFDYMSKKLFFVVFIALSTSPFFSNSCDKTCICVFDDSSIAFHMCCDAKVHCLPDIGAGCRVDYRGEETERERERERDTPVL